MLHYKIHEEIRLIKGVLRGIAYDLNRKNYDFLPNILIDILYKFNGQSLSALKRELIQVSDKTIAQEYLDFLLEKEYIFLMKKEYMPLFPELDLTWKMPATIYSAILDIDDEKLIFQNKIIEQLEDLSCKHIIFRFIKSCNFSQIGNFLQRYKSTGFQSFNIWINIPENFDIKSLEELCQLNPKIVYVNLFNYKGKKTDKLSLNHPLLIKYHTGHWEDSNDCLVNIKNFKVNIAMFTESLTYNTYFNQKIYIDRNGSIRNSPNCVVVGNVNQISIASTITDKLKFLWTSSKDKTIVCRECEFRYMCQDSRIPILLGNGNFFFEQECNYNPYIAKWKGRAGFKPLKECGAFDSEKEFIPDYNRIEKLNQQLWQDTL